MLETIIQTSLAYGATLFVSISVLVLMYAFWDD